MSSIAPFQNRSRTRVKVVPVPARPASPRAAGCGQDVVDRLLESARRLAELAGLDPVPQVVDETVHAQILDRLDMPPRANGRFQRLLKTAAPWDVP